MQEGGSHSRGDFYFSNFAAKQTLTMEQKLRIPTFTCHRLCIQLKSHFLILIKPDVEYFPFTDSYTCMSPLMGLVAIVPTEILHRSC